MGFMLAVLCWGCTQVGAEVLSGQVSKVKQELSEGLPCKFMGYVWRQFALNDGRQICGLCWLQVRVAVRE